MRKVAPLLFYIFVFIIAPAMADESNVNDKNNEILRRRACQMFTDGFTYGEVFQSIRNAVQAEFNSSRRSKDYNPVIEDLTDFKAYYTIRVAVLDCPQFRDLVPVKSVEDLRPRKLEF